MSLTVEEMCPKCGAKMYTYTNQGNSTTGECVIKTICSSCGYEKPNVSFTTYGTFSTTPEFTIGGGDPHTVIIQADDIKLSQKDLGMTIDVPFSALCKIETIQINGIKFVKEN